MKIRSVVQFWAINFFISEMWKRERKYFLPGRIFVSAEEEVRLCASQPPSALHTHCSLGGHVSLYGPFSTASLSSVRLCAITKLSAQGYFQIPSMKTAEQSFTPSPHSSQRLTLCTRYSGRFLNNARFAQVGLWGGTLELNKNVTETFPNNPPDVLTPSG